jgi:hypothetical protein
MSLLTGVRRTVRERLRHRRELEEHRAWAAEGWRVEREIEEVIGEGRRVLVGPWLSEVGYEALYWVPFLRWVKAAFRLSPDRVVALSRGGVGSWYAGIADRYVEAWDLVTPEEFARRTLERGSTKQLEPSAFDRDLVAAVEAQLGERVSVLHPSLMYRLFGEFWSGHRAMGFLDAHTRYEPVSPPVVVDPQALPRDYVAVKFYEARSLPGTPEVRRVVTQIVERLAERTPVVLLDTGLVLDEHADYTVGTSSRVVSARPWMTPTTNLAVQTQIIAGARAFVGTCGSVAWLAPMLGVHTSALYVDPKWLHVHLGVALRATHKMGAGCFAPVDLRGLDPLGLGLPVTVRTS